MDDIVSRVLHNSNTSKAVKTSLGKSLTQPMRLIDHRPPLDPLADFYVKIRDTARLTDGITLAERIAVLTTSRTELVVSFQTQIDAAKKDLQ